MIYREKAEAMTTILGGRTFSSEAEAHKCSVDMMEAFGRECAAEAYEDSAKFIRDNTVASYLEGSRVARRVRGDEGGILLSNELMFKASALRQGAGKGE